MDPHRWTIIGNRFSRADRAASRRLRLLETHAARLHRAVSMPSPTSNMSPITVGMTRSPKPAQVGMTFSARVDHDPHVRTVD